jgi:hypothetical protein
VTPLGIWQAKAVWHVVPRGIPRHEALQRLPEAQREAPAALEPLDFFSPGCTMLNAVATPGEPIQIGQAALPGIPMVGTYPRMASDLLRCCRLRLLACCLLTLWAAFDSSAVALWGLAIPLPLSQNGSPAQDGDDDDEMLDLSKLMASQQAAGRKIRVSLTLLVRITSTYPAPVTHHRLPLASLVCEHENRNGVGAPLLC